MKSLYWRSNHVSTRQLVAVAVLAVGGLAWVETSPIEERDPLFEQKLAAARLAEQGFRAVNLERIRLQIPLEPEFDPAGSGLIGPAHTPIVSNEGHLASKQTSANPNFAAVFVEMLHEAGVREGDRVAVTATGSFPAMNITMFAALETMGARPMVISSVASSEFGATHPELTWLDMERVLYEAEVIGFRSVAASLGGVVDIARNHSDEGRALLTAALARNDCRLLTPRDYDHAVSLRLALFDELRGDDPIRAFVNIGGGTAAVGKAEDKVDFAAGLNTELPSGLENPSVMRAYLEAGTPAIHVSRIRSLARSFGLADVPMEVPRPGEGGVFRLAIIPPWTIALTLLAIFLAMWAATRFDLFAIFQRRRAEQKSGPVQMV
ncbi:MAG: poly-gamma-glutamate system protein [Myxococcota bacterium]